MEEEKTKQKIIETLEKLNATTDEKALDELWNALWELAPFSYYNERIEELQAEVEELKQTVKLLRRHKHIATGETVVTL